jgi:hypothetical protein
MAGLWVQRGGDKRPDGSLKGQGYQGVWQRTDDPNMSSSEISFGTTDVNGTELDIPRMVPTTSREERDYMLGTPINEIETKDPNMARAIRIKAIDFARQRIREGRNVFAQKGEDQFYYPPPTQDKNYMTKQMIAKTMNGLNLAFGGAINKVLDSTSGEQ